MPAVTRLGDASAGHCYGSRPPDDAAQGDVFANNILVTIVGAHYPTHCCGPVCHDGAASAGSPTVFIHNQPVHRIGDAISCGDTSAAGSPNVFANS
jgi:uncharacterized Zn-binding protein involved in type VI secretion